jgi:hypothetical protein
MKILVQVSLFVLLAGMFSCSDDFVNVDNPGALSPANYPNSVTDLEQLLTGVYATQHANGLFGHTMYAKNSWLWDHTTDLSWQGTPTWIQMGQNNSQPNDSFLYDTWRELWRGVQRSNTLLNAAELYRQKAPQDAAAIDQIKGQALFLRAWYYFYLVSYWGETFIVNGQGGDKLGVPIITESASSLEATQVTRNTVKEGWDFIIADLKASETLLNGVTWTGATDKYKVSGWAVKGFLGKVYVYQEDWANAKTYLSDVVTNSGKSLVPFDVYKNMFNGINEFTSESLFELNLNVDMTARGGDDQSMGSSMGMVIAPTFVSDNGGQSASAWSNVFPHAKNIARFGFNEGHYFKQGTTSANIANVDPAYVSKSLLAKQNKTVDPRLWVACYQPYVDSMIVSGKKRPISHYLDVTELDMEAWSFRKFTNPTGTEAEINMSSGANFPWLRLADIYLLICRNPRRIPVTMQLRWNTLTRSRGAHIIFLSMQSVGGGLQESDRCDQSE